ncbi:cytochrome P450 [Gloeophyllum trabeum ATCC 11539]|uniref:Cytochrome P450 n=1 Tax=Gloeophyllum trabeum (strain ATCC 11539 / FP-39264 / Madison 617) TaxID=670483 RepID=S7QP42_GLOTA|nr:cytochrome P450 [Gloeophyllum trabeum ATCC 11539]EPQ61077.1 cytochrome P450 [Gloeophyllum trabeum ATCC 11539]
MYSWVHGVSSHGILYNTFVYPFVLSPLKGVSGPPVGNPLLGVFLTIGNSEPGVIQREWVKQYGPFVRAIGPFGLERLVIVRPADLERILVTGWLECPRPDFMKNILGMVAGCGLLTVTGEEHRLMRKILNPAFSIPNLMSQTEMYYEPIETLIQKLKTQIRQNGDMSKEIQTHMYNWMSKVTLDIICRTSFGYDCNSLLNPDNELAVAYENLLKLQSNETNAKLVMIMLLPGGPALLRSEWGYQHRHWFNRIPGLSPVSTMMTCMRQIRSICARLLDEKIAESLNVHDIAGKKDIMSLLLNARASDRNPLDSDDKSSGGYHMDDRALIEQMLTFLGAGHETTASGLSWVLWLLASHPNAQSKLRAEVLRTTGSNPRPDYRTLKDLEYLDCVIMESLRVLPPVAVTNRIADEGFWFNSVWVPKGTLFCLPIRAINTWKDIWGNDAEE